MKFIVSEGPGLLHHVLKVPKDHTWGNFAMQANVLQYSYVYNIHAECSKTVRCQTYCLIILSNDITSSVRVYETLPHFLPYPTIPYPTLPYPSLAHSLPYPTLLFPTLP